MKKQIVINAIWFLMGAALMLGALSSYLPNNKSVELQVKTTNDITLTFISDRKTGLYLHSSSNYLQMTNFNFRKYRPLR